MTVWPHDHPCRHRMMATVYQHERICLRDGCDCGGYEPPPREP